LSVCSNYSFEHCQKTASSIRNFRGGEAYFTFPTGPVKCAGAPQKIMYLAHSAWKKDAVQANCHFATPLGGMFSVPKYGKALDNLCKKKNITRHYGHNLIEIKGDEKKAVFQIIPEVNSEVKEKTVTVDFDFMHVTPRMGAPDFLKETGLTDAAGFVNVNKQTLQHVEYPNVFSLGDCSNLPTSKTASAVAGQIAIARYRAGKYLQSKESLSPSKKDFPNWLEGEEEGPIYDGYSSCPLPVGDNMGIIAEFNYDLQPQETMAFDQSVPSWTNYIIKTKVLPPLYWDLFVKGKWEGPARLRKILNPKGK